MGLTTNAVNVRPAWMGASWASAWGLHASRVSWGIAVLWSAERCASIASCSFPCFLSRLLLVLTFYVIFVFYVFFFFVLFVVTGSFWHFCIYRCFCFRGFVRSCFHLYFRALSPLFCSCIFYLTCVHFLVLSCSSTFNIFLHFVLYMCSFSCVFVLFRLYFVFYMCSFSCLVFSCFSIVENQHFCIFAFLHIVFLYDRYCLFSTPCVLYCTHPFDVLFVRGGGRMFFFFCFSLPSADTPFAPPRFVSHASPLFRRCAHSCAGCCLCSLSPWVHPTALWLVPPVPILLCVCFYGCDECGGYNLHDRCLHTPVMMIAIIAMDVMMWWIQWVCLADVPWVGRVAVWQCLFSFSTWLVAWRFYLSPMESFAFGCRASICTGVIGRASFLQSDMQEVQSMYRAQYDELLSKQGLTAGSGK